MKHYFLLVITAFCIYQKSNGSNNILSGEDSVSAFNFFMSHSIDLKKVDNPELYFEIYNWLNTPYVLGGNSKNGIDCSNFVRIIYKNVYKQDFEGNSIAMNPKCTQHSEIDMSAEGDLLFFKINKSEISHVAIYLQHGKFAHVTVHGGVIISDVNESYWRKYYHSAARPQLHVYAKD